MKTYVLTLSRYFPATHARKGEPTGFIEKIKAREKIHTIRGNYPFWEERFKKIKRGEALLSLRCWEGEPYRSSQVEFMRLFHEHEIGIQRLEATPLGWFIDSYDSDITNDDLAKGDGLSTEDFQEWFKGYDLSDPLGIIHFTKFRY